jgi:hypothetical protein
MYIHITVPYKHPHTYIRIHVYMHINVIQTQTQTQTQTDQQTDGWTDYRGTDRPTYTDMYSLKDPSAGTIHESGTHSDSWSLTGYITCIVYVFLQHILSLLISVFHIHTKRVRKYTRSTYIHIHIHAHTQFRWIPSLGYDFSVLDENSREIRG